MNSNHINSIVDQAKNLVCEAHDVVLGRYKYYTVIEREGELADIRNMPIREFYSYLCLSCEKIGDNIRNWDNSVDVYRQRWYPFPPLCETHPHSVESAYILRRAYDYYLQARKLCDHYLPQYSY
jgi:hypothetical protein